jgi:hypothetical protein
MGWAAGIQYDGDIYRANTVLGNLSSFYPGAKCYEVAGFFWWQGDRDSRDMGLSTLYEKNLVRLIKQLRVQYVFLNIFWGVVIFVHVQYVLKHLLTVLTHLLIRQGPSSNRAHWTCLSLGILSTLLISCALLMCLCRYIDHMGCFR